MFRSKATAVAVAVAVGPAGLLGIAPVARAEPAAPTMPVFIPYPSAW